MGSRFLMEEMPLESHSGELYRVIQPLKKAYKESILLIISHYM